MVKKLLAAGLAVAFMAPALQAGEIQTDWIQPVEGHREGTLGASVRAVEPDAEGGSTLTIAIPKPVMEGSTDIQEVIVTGRRPDASEERLEIRHEWLADYENDNYGLVLYLGKHGNVPLRVYLKSPD